MEENLEQVRKEYMAYKAKSTRQITELHDEVQAKKKEHSALLNQIDDERKKVEDLQFRLEEAQLLAEDDSGAGADKLKAVEGEKDALVKARDELTKVGHV